MSAPREVIAIDSDNDDAVLVDRARRPPPAKRARLTPSLSQIASLISERDMQLRADEQLALSLVLEDAEAFQSLPLPPLSLSSSPSLIVPVSVSNASSPNIRTLHDSQSLSFGSQLTEHQRQLVAEHHRALNDGDPHADVYALFAMYSELFFPNQLDAVSVRYSKRMTSCAGLCRFDTRQGCCEIALSEALLQYRSKQEVIETLLHEMIHAFLFVGNHSLVDRDDHGENFCAIMGFVNRTLGLSITVYHSFHSEVKSFKVHVWQCDGPCQYRPPYYGKVSRAMNRAPGPSDSWHAQHQASCSGTFVKISEPPPKAKSKNATAISTTGTDGKRARGNGKKVKPVAAVARKSKPKTGRQLKLTAGKGHVLGGANQINDTGEAKDDKERRDISAHLTPATEEESKESVASGKLSR